MTPLTLAPYPHTLNQTGETITMPAYGTIASPHAGLLFEGEWLQTLLTQFDCTYQLAVNHPGAFIRLQQNTTLPPQAYTLTITADGLTITGGDPAGIFYGLCTLRQLMLNVGTTLPTLSIEDAPAFKVRGYMLDVSRDRVPRRAELFRLVDELAGLKINQLQLYVEHTFAYPGHESVWEHADPLTPEDVLLLDHYCKQRHIELVPNQNSLGHMERWLKHAPYKHLAEVSDSFIGPDGKWRKPSTLAPGNPQSLTLMHDLYDYLLPHFSSQRLNVGCDEPWELGQGVESAPDADKGRVYLDWLLSLHKDLTQRGYRMLFWGDIIINYPHLIPELPQDAIVLEWGYEANHPFDEHCDRYAQAGIPFYVCPGTSSWNTLAGRTQNTIGNAKAAAKYGLEHGAHGYLITDWGDNGHWQAPTASYAGMVYGAAVAWGYEHNHALDLSAALNRLMFHDSTDIMGQIAVEAGDLYQQIGPDHINGSVLAYALHWRKHEVSQGLARIEAWGGAPADVSTTTLHTVITLINNLLARLQTSKPDRDDHNLLVREWQQALSLLKHGAKWLLLAQDQTDYDAATLLYEWDGLIIQQRELWLKRSRRGGLEDSMRRFQTLRNEYLRLMDDSK